jgi:pimeloyl-ACP methyl ester carboxylesterase
MPRPENRTPVRPRRIGALSWGLRALGAAAPSVAARVGERLFLTPPHHAAPRREREALRHGHAFDVPFAGGRLRAWRFGRDPRVLFLHGWGGRGGQLLSLAAPLREAGIPFATFDAPAHGLSSGRTASVPEFAAALRAVADHLGSVRAVVGHSMGGASTAVAVGQGLALDAAVFIGTPRNPAGFFGEFATTLALHPSLAEKVRARLEHRFGMSLADFDVTRLVPTAPPPLLVIHDTQDKEVPWENGEAIARQWPGARLLTTQGLGHKRVLHAAEVAEAVAAFLIDRVGGDAMRCDSPGCDGVASHGGVGSRRLCASCALDAQLYAPALRALGAA